MSERSEMALLQHQRLPGIGCSNILARARAQCLAAASHAACLPVLLCVVAEASAAANVTPAQAPRSIGVGDVLWPSAGESETSVFFAPQLVFLNLYALPGSFREVLLNGCGRVHPCLGSCQTMTTISYILATI